MIWRSNITVWNSHDVLLLLFTSTLGVIIEVNIFYTNTIPRWAVFYWGAETWVQAANIYIVLLVWWCPEGSEGWFGGICVWPGEEKFNFCVISSYGECVCVSNALNIDLLDVQNAQWNLSVAIPAAGSVRWASRQKIWGLRLPRGIVLSATATFQLIKKKKKCQLPEVGNALGSEMKMSKNFPRYLAHCLFLQILYRKINSSFSALWDVPINTLSIYRVRSLVRNRCCNLSVGLCL